MNSKPKIYRIGRTWFCRNAYAYAYGFSPVNAYARWLTFPGTPAKKSISA